MSAAGDRAAAGGAHEPLSPGYGFSRRSGVLPGPAVDGQRIVYLRADADPMAVLEIRRRSAERLQLATLSTEEFDRKLREQHERSSGEAMNLVEGLGDEGDLLSVAESLAEPEDLLEAEDDAPIIRLINALLTEAVRENASDIHIEPFESRLSVRLRVDGVLREVLNPPVGLAPLIVSRVKVMARLDIAEKRLPQDGRISLRVAGRPVDVRVSTLPSGHGERVVMRLLDKQAGRLELRHLGMSQEQYDAMERVIGRPHGIVLVTGPTGSGKTTTLYAALMRLNDRSRNILTVEDPIEYYLDGIGQTQINTRVDMTFARGLRAILRQDPDVVMVGEIRDLETVQIAVQASLTGHLVFSTLHTNSAVGAITRLRDMGVEPFLLASTLNGILAQRLVRVLCTSCREPAAATRAECELLGQDPGRPPTIYHARGCPDCNGLGYRGRTGIYELIEVDDTLRQMIHDGAGERAMTDHARRSTPGIRSDGVRRILDGTTSVEEVVRVTRED
ncbi:General secretion pathway protein E [Thioalkalivibrio nitratireducens DSM 14787]|uniref:Type II secretion system protein E n=1 Tax=Thioalkalivibrio nitratireducens (strain DSM 14787 / UNIQEM 213 / ALEN2) TaxID=1255043 RepID=L0E2J0_THIND|nr:type II secretion system ATPase GspE [Thioalkalivibrio nitratireducens]AGA35467.1 General secretion pathway protein E [Thioalkalivibrio nitratireducens DSM 14787]